VERAEAEAIYEAGRERCVGVILELAASVERLRGLCGRLEERVRRLEEQSGQSSRNSSKPPSQDPPKTRVERRAEARAKAKAWAKRERERKAGGQPGQPGSGRELLAEEQVEIVDHYPDACRGCGYEFAEEERRPCGRFGRRQQAELPAIAVVFFEHRRHRLRCPECKRKTAAVLPAAVAGSAFGPGLQAAVVTLTARNRVSRRHLAELARDLFGLRLSAGAVDAVCQRASAALALPQERLVEQVLAAAVVNVDETGWFTQAEGRTLSTATTCEAAIFRIAEHRHRDRLEELIGSQCNGIVGSDRWSVYNHIDPASRQACWQHVKRDFHSHSEGMAEQQEFGQTGLALTTGLFQRWRAFQEHHDRKHLTREMKPIQDELRRLLDNAARKNTKTKHHRRFATNLIKIWPALWTLVTVPAVEPTNNAAEHALRGPVIHRKLSHGSQSKDGERFIERALTASLTCRLQHRSLFTHLHHLLTAHNRGHPLPTLT